MKIRATVLIIFSFWLQAGAVESAPKSRSFTHSFSLNSYFVPPIAWVLKDAAFFIFNPSSRQLHVQATLTAVGNPSFQFSNDGLGGAPYQTGTFRFYDLTIEPYSDCGAHSGFLGYSVFGFAIPFSGPQFVQNFTLTVSGDTDFYFYGPGDGFLVSGSSYTSSGEGWAVNAYRNAWQSFDRQIPVEWDSGLKLWVAPFANFWHNTNDFPRGWQTSVTIRRTTSGTKTFTIRNKNQNSGHHGHTTSGTVGPLPIPGHGCCSSVPSVSGLCDTRHSFNVLCQTVEVAGYSTVTKDAYRFHINEENARTSHDGQIAVTVAGNNPSGSVVQVRVFPNSSGARLCP